VLWFNPGVGFDEVQGQVITNLYDRERAEDQRRIETQDFAQEHRRRVPIPGGHDRVVQLCWHGIAFSIRVMT
jgi:hypothetical protein